MADNLLKNIPIPASLAQNDLDRRGFPIPFIVYRDERGTPHFTVDDVNKIEMILAQNLCALCAGPLEPGHMWLISGASSAFLNDGLYTIPPAHEACARYAVQICPFLAASKYSRLIEDKTLAPDALHTDAHIHNDQIAPSRPSVMVLARTSRITLIDPGDGSGKHYIVPHRPWEAVEFWRHGQQLSTAEAAAIIAQSEMPPDQMPWWPA